MQSSCYCFNLRAAARKTTALYDEALAPAGINVAQFGLLRRIQRVGAPSLTELAGLAELDRSTVGRNVKVLERMGLVGNGPGEDHREAAVSLTAAGAEAIRNAAPLWDEAQRRVEGVLGLEGARALRALAQAL